MQLNDLHKITSAFTDTDLMPLLFMGHGSPMNAIEENEFVTGWRTVGKTLPKPNAILCISAHWETKGTFVTAMEKPQTIHDFGGFPQALFDVQYPAPGSPVLAKETSQLVTSTSVGLDEKWGLDHGAWSVISRIYPKADIPVVQLSLDYSMAPQDHFNLAREIAALRKKGILIIGSGNMVHNLRMIDWHNPNSGFDWALEANARFKQLISGHEYQQLINYSSLGKAVSLSIPTPEHYLPLLYILGLKQEKEKVDFFNDQMVMGSISMTSFKIS